MAVFTPLSAEDADRVARAHGLGACIGITPIPAGSVNSNFFLDTEQGKVFLRVYEEQDETGVGYEWTLLQHLAEAGVPVPQRRGDVTPGEVRVADKPTAVFALVEGEDLCLGMVDPERTYALGQALARVHGAGADFGWKREGRFTRASLLTRLDQAQAHGREELVAPIARLREIVAMCEAAEAARPELPRGIVHGDMFRDNVFWEKGAEATISAIIDWESASDGVLLYDLAVVLLAWCYADDFEWANARALVQGYEAARPLTADEWAAFRVTLIDAAARFATTRITDFHLRDGGVGERVMKDYRRFLSRLEAIAVMTDVELRARLTAA